MMDIRSLRFCMVTTFYPPYHFGGDAVYVYRLANTLARRGHRVDVVHDRDAYYLLHRGEPSAPIENHPNVTVHSLKSPLGPLSPVATQQTGYPFFKRRLRTLLEREPYDIVHFHNASLIGPAAFSYGRALKLYTLHEHWLVCPMHTLWRLDRELCTRRTCVRCMLHGRRPPQLWRATGFLARQLAHIDRFISPSRFTRDKHQELGLKRPTALLPFFVPGNDAAEVAPAPHHRPYFLFVGRLVKIKGLQTLFPVFRQYPDADLLIAGEGEYELVLRAGAADLPNVRFLGAQSHAALGALYRHAIALIMPSICYEVFGIVLLEAFAAGTPVIVRNLGGMPEAVEDSGAGFVYDDDRTLVDSMRTLHQDTDLRRRLSERALEAWRRLWSEDVHILRYFEIIDEVAAGRRTRAAADGARR